MSSAMLLSDPERAWGVSGEKTEVLVLENAEMLKLARGGGGK